MIRFYFLLLLLVAGYFLLRGLIRRLLNSQKQTEHSKNQQHYAFKGKMTEAEAYEVLGLPTGASKQDIIAAHRKLMQKNHPDHGGSDYLAAKINLAKHTLLKNRR